MNNRNLTRVLGCYLLLCTTYQVGIRYCSGFFPSPHTVFGDWSRYESSTWFEFGNPRTVFLFFDGLWSDIAYWGSAAWLLAIAIAILAKPGKRSLLRAYFIVELTLTILGLADLFVTMAVRGILPAYTVSRDFELQTLAAVFLLFSVVPCAFALWMLRKTRVAKL